MISNPVATALKSAFLAREDSHPTFATRRKREEPRCQVRYASGGRRRAGSDREVGFPIISNGALRAIPQGPRCPRNQLYRCVAGDIGVATRCEIAKESMFRKTMKCFVT